jgi:Flp pilus assembly protein TadD
MNGRDGALEPVLLEAANLAEAGRPVEAFELLRAQEEEHGDDPMLLCMLGVVATEAFAPGLAYDYFRRSLAAEPEDPELLVTLGTELARYDDPEAERVLRLAATLAPQMAAAHRAYGAYLAREGLAGEALAELERARSLEPDDPDTEREIGVAHLLGGDRAAGAAALESASALDPEDSETRLLYGLALVLLGRSDEAAEELLRVSTESPEEGEVHVLTALACAAEGWTDQAWDALARAEAAEVPAEASLLREAEDAVEDGSPEAIRRLLSETLAPTLLRERLLERR